MDRRTLLFIILVGITFFGFNLYLGHQRDTQERAALEKREAEKKQKLDLLQQDQLQKTASLESLPLVKISTDPSGQEIVGYGINVGNATLTLAWQRNLPQIVYVNGSAQELLTQDSVKGGPVLFGAKNFSQFQMASLPEQGTFDLQLVTFDNGSAQAFYTQYVDGTLEFPLGKVNHNGIGLYKSSNGYLPLGFYESQGNVFVELQNLPQLINQVKKPPSPSISTLPAQNQNYFVLENPYMQLVFSNIGGALTEINLPFSSKSDQKSVVKEIGFDRDIIKESSQNAKFPLYPSFIPNQETVEPAVGGYYPLIRRDQIGKKTIKISPQFYALNLVSDYPEMAQLNYEVKEFSSEKIVFQASQAYRKITKTFYLPQGEDAAPYIFEAFIQIDGDSRGLWVVSGIPEVEIMSNSSSPQVEYRITKKGKYEVDKLDLPKPKEAISVSSITPDWVVNSNGYLGVILDPLDEIASGFKATAWPGETVPTRLNLIDPKYRPYPASKYPGYQVMLPLSSQGKSYHFRIYAGPFEENTLKAVDKIYTDPQTGQSPDYLAAKTFYGWFSFISEPFAKFLYVVMKFFYSITHSWGFSIILLTVFLRLLLYPLNAWSIKSMRRMQKISPQIQAIQQKYKKEPKKAQMEIMNLYREKKVNPFMGCIPILIQIPFLIGMFDLLKSSFQLRGASFIPGWIDNLTAPDVLFEWQRPIFFIGNQFHLLPLLLGAVMFLQQRLSSPTPKDPTQMTDQQRQQKAMGTIMTGVFTIMFYHFPSGLNIYWLSSMLLGIVQQWITNRYLDTHKTEKLNDKDKKMKLTTKKIK